MPNLGYRLDALIQYADRMPQIRKADLSSGDRVIVKTENSIYSIRIISDAACVVSGGWFDRKGLSPMKTRISGCTWGGSTIKVDVVAACGLRLEFGNRLVTTTIQKIFILPAGIEN